MIGSRRVLAWGGLVLALAVTRGCLALVQPRFEPPAVLLDFDAAEVDRVEIARGDVRVELARQGEGWVVASSGDLPAHAGVGGLIERLAGWRRERVAGETPRPEWGVGPEGRHVTLRSGDRIVGQLIVGQVTGVEPEDVREVGYALDTSQLGLFVRLPSEKRVYVVTDFVTRELEPDPRRWFTPPLPFPQDQIARLQRGGAEGFDLRVGPFRFATDPTPVDPRRAGSLLGWISQLRTVGPSAEQLTDGVPLRLEAGGQPHTALVGMRGERALLQLGEQCLEVEPLPVSRLIAGTRESLVRKQLVLNEARDLVRVEASRGELRVGFSRVRGAWVADSGAEVPDVDAVVAALGSTNARWTEPAVGKIASATLQLYDEHGNSEVLWLLDSAAAEGERVALGGVSLVAELEGRPLAEALRVLLGQ